MRGVQMGNAAVNRVIGVLGRRFRQRRMTMFIDTLKPNRETRILDVGGTVAFWASSGVISADRRAEPGFMGGWRRPGEHQLQ